MSAELLLGRYISSLLVGLLRKTMNFFSVACLQLGNSISVHRGFAHDPLRIGRNLVGR